MTTITENAIPQPRRRINDAMIAFALMTALLLIVPLTGIYPFFVMQALCFALLACAFNLLIGYGGLLSFGHAMFLGTAGYFTAHALKVWGFSPQLGILVASFVVIESGWYCVYAFGGRSLAAWLAPANRRRLFNRGSGLIFIGFGAALLGSRV